MMSETGGGCDHTWKEDATTELEGHREEGFWECRAVWMVGRGVVVEDGGGDGADGWCGADGAKATYQPKPAQRVWIPKAGSKEMRPLGIPPVENRVVEMAVRNVIEPIFEHTFAQRSYGFRPGRGAKDALRRVNQLLREGKTWVVDADLKGYFDSIPQDKLV